MSRVAETAQDHLNRAVTETIVVTGKTVEERNKERLRLQAAMMRRLGWKEVTAENIVDIAEALGFHVRGNLIYPLQ